MRVKVEHKTSTEQDRRSFDIRASVSQFAYDLENYGEIKAETREQVKNEELSLICEGLPGASRTEFTYLRNGNDLVYFKDGKWQPYYLLFEIGLTAAAREAEKDYRKQFLKDRAIDEQRHGYRVRQLQPGQSYSWHSSYPEEEARQYGEEFIKSEGCGFNPDRKLGFIYHARCEDDGSVVLQTQTVDRSEQGAFDAIDEAKRHDPDMDIDTMTRIYDGFLYKKYGQYFFAGRTEQEQNAWTFINQQHDLIKFHIHKLESIARANLPEPDKTLDIKNHMYSVWAAFAKRFKGQVNKPVETNELPEHFEWRLSGAEVFHLQLETNRALEEFAGTPWIGCGGSILVDKELQDIKDALPEDVFKAIFGDSSKSSEVYKFDKKMFCVVCQAPPRRGETKKKCGPCGLCKSCDKKAGGKG
jgi:hypothetical protein